MCSEAKQTSIKDTPFIARFKAKPEDKILYREWYEEMSAQSECDIPLLPTAAYYPSDI